VSLRLSDPVSDTWSLKLQDTVTLTGVAGHGTQPKNTLEFQPTLPVRLTEHLKLIARPEFTLLDSVPYAGGQGALRRTTGVGDTILDVVVAPRATAWLLGLGPTFVFPTANLDQTGQGKWQAGPAGVAGYRAPGWLAAVIAQQWFSFAGAEDRAAVSELHLQYIASYVLGDGWSVGTSPIIKVDWRAAAGERLTFPFGLTLAKVVRLAGRLPVKFELDAMYVPVHPTDGAEAIFKLAVIPVIPALLQAPLFASR